MRKAVLGMVLAVWPLAGWGQADTGRLLREQGIAPAIAALEGETDRAFEHGMLLALRAWERLLQTGLDHRFDLRRGLMAGPRPGTLPRARWTPETLARIAEEMLADLDLARQMLDRADDGQSFTLDPRDIWFDADRDGRRSGGEGLDRILVPPSPSQLMRNDGTPPSEPAPLPVRFDTADRAWLLARLHAASGVLQLGLAFDPAPVLRDLALREPAPGLLAQVPEYHDLDAMAAELAELETALKAAQEEDRALAAESAPQRKALNERRAAVQQAMGDLPRDAPERAALQAESREIAEAQEALNIPSRAANLRQTELRRAIAARKAALPEDPRRPGWSALSGAHMVTTLHVAQAALHQQPDARRIAAAMDHWRTMLAQEASARALAAAETDDDREWLRGPRQQDTALPLTLLPPRQPRR